MAPLQRRPRRSPAGGGLALAAAATALLAAAATTLVLLPHGAAAASTAGAWAQCGGSGVDRPWDGVNCPPGYTCARLDQFFWRCSAAPPKPSPSPAAAADGGNGTASIDGVPSSADTNDAAVMRRFGARPAPAQPGAGGKEEATPAMPAAAAEPAGAPAGAAGNATSSASWWSGTYDAKNNTAATNAPAPAPKADGGVVKVADWGQCGGLAGCRTPDRPCAQAPWPGYACGPEFTCTRIDGYWFQCRNDQLAVKQRKATEEQTRAATTPAKARAQQRSPAPEEDAAAAAASPAPAPEAPLAQADYLPPAAPVKGAKLPAAGEVEEPLPRQQPRPAPRRQAPLPAPAEEPPLPAEEEEEEATPLPLAPDADLAGNDTAAELDTADAPLEMPGALAVPLAGNATRAAARPPPPVDVELEYPSISKADFLRQYGNGSLAAVSDVSGVKGDNITARYGVPGPQRRLRMRSLLQSADGNGVVARYALSVANKAASERTMLRLDAAAADGGAGWTKALRASGVPLTPSVRVNGQVSVPPPAAPKPPGPRLSAGAIAGIVIGSFFGLLLLGLLCWLLCCRKRAPKAAKAAKVAKTTTAVGTTRDVEAGVAAPRAGTTTATKAAVGTGVVAGAGAAVAGGAVAASRASGSAAGAEMAPAEQYPRSFVVRPEESSASGDERSPKHPQAARGPAAPVAAAAAGVGAVGAAGVAAAAAATTSSGGGAAAAGGTRSFGSRLPSLRMGGSKAGSAAGGGSSAGGAAAGGAAAAAAYKDLPSTPTGAAGMADAGEDFGTPRSASSYASAGSRPESAASFKSAATGATAQTAQTAQSAGTFRSARTSATTATTASAGAYPRAYAPGSPSGSDGTPTAGGPALPPAPLPQPKRK
jgi:hypothetical protein